uniref:Uncharacterized protein n=1 Tax=Mycena chlorophos TaxID=658473 RepID=A0ABQ0LUT6_MYCCL|nr:predicted protein [Mycena chlorophos]
MLSARSFTNHHVGDTVPGINAQHKKRTSPTIPGHMRTTAQLEADAVARLSLNMHRILIVLVRHISPEDAKQQL